MFHFQQMVAKLPNANDQVTREIDDYEKQLIDIDTLSEKANEAQREKDDMKHKLDLLEKRVKVNLTIHMPKNIYRGIITISISQTVILIKRGTIDYV